MTSAYCHLQEEGKMFFEKAKRDDSEGVFFSFEDVTGCKYFTRYLFEMASKLKCILEERQYFFAIVFCRRLSFNVIGAISSQSPLIVCISLSFTVSYRVE